MITANWKTLCRFIVLPFILCPSAHAAEQNLLQNFYRLAVPAALKFADDVTKDNSSTDFQTHVLFDNIEILTAANNDLPKEQRPSLAAAAALLRLAGEMQEQNPDSRNFGNFRWYKSTPAVTDANAVEFVCTRALPCWFEGQMLYDNETKKMLRQILERCINACLVRKISPDYTNIALCNAVNLMLLGQIFAQDEITAEGENRLRHIIIAFWEHGIAEYNSPPYIAVAIDSLQLALRYIQNEETKQCIRKTLDYLYTDFSLHWYRKGLRLAGAQSRTYQYQIGVSAHTTRLAAFAGLGPIDRQAKYAAMLNSFRAVYQPPKSITDLNQIYPRYVQRRWGSKAEQSAALMMYEDIALGTAGTGYGSRHDMPLTVDLPDDDTTEDLTHRHFLPRCYFIADGRSDPYGIKKEPAGKAGHPKALHLDALWSAAQRTFETVADVSYPPEIRQTAESVQSVFVLRKTDSVQAEQDTFIFRYNKAAVIIRILESAEPPVLTTDESALRLTVPHRKEDGDKPLRFSLRIESQHSPERTNMPEPADVPMPVGVLSLNGRELARPILEEIPFVKRFAEELRNAPAVKITDTAIWQADSAVSTLPCSAPPCMPIRQQVHWKMQVDRADTYYLWCYVWAKDNEHDSVFMQLAEERQPLSFMERWNTAWHLGSGVQYRWVCFPQPLKLSAGAWRLTFLPRETDVCIKHLYITTQPQDCPVQQ